MINSFPQLALQPRCFRRIFSYSASLPQNVQIPSAKCGQKRHSACSFMTRTFAWSQKWKRRRRHGFVSVQRLDLRRWLALWVMSCPHHRSTAPGRLRYKLCTWTAAQRWHFQSMRSSQERLVGVDVAGFIPLTNSDADGPRESSPFPHRFIDLSSEDRSGTHMQTVGCHTTCAPRITENWNPKSSWQRIGILNPREWTSGGNAFCIRCVLCLLDHSYCLFGTHCKVSFQQTCGETQNFPMCKSMRKFKSQASVIWSGITL